MSWQACPICHGRGTVARGFYDGVGYTAGTSTAVPSREQCRSCKGAGVLLDPSAPAPAVGITPPWRVTCSVSRDFAQSSQGGIDPRRYWNMQPRQHGVTA